MSNVRRPLLRYLGGKFKIASWVIAHFPPHQLYVEPFGGAASVLLRKAPSHGEVYNDLDRELVNLFQVLRDPALAGRLVELIGLTPYSRAEWEAAYQPSRDPVERARRMLVRPFMGFGSCAAAGDRNTGFRRAASREYRTPAQEWGRYPPHLAAIVERVQSGVQLECKPALEVIAERDGPDTLFYVDPPYVHDTRSAKRARGQLHSRYPFEMTDAQHAELLVALRDVEGMVVLSGYPHPLYETWLRGWRREERHALADGARPRREVLWINPAASAALAASGARIDEEHLLV